MLTVGFGFLRFFGQGSLMLVVQISFHNGLIKTWLCHDIMALGFGISMAIHPPLSQFLIDHYGWKFAWVFLGISTWIVMVPALYLLAWNTPESVGLSPDGGAKIIN